MPKRKEITGWSVGHKVWFVATFDGVRMAHRYKECAEDMVLASDKTDPYGRILVRMGDGVEEAIRKDLLRLTPPPGLSGKSEKAKEVKPRPRKGATDPAFGEELPLF